MEKGNPSFSRSFGHPHSRILVREGDDGSSTLSVRKMEIMIESKREMGTASFPKYLHICAHRLLRDMWRLLHLIAIELGVSVFLTLKSKRLLLIGKERESLWI